jgi:hypothetical protein
MGRYRNYKFLFSQDINMICIHFADNHIYLIDTIFKTSSSIKISNEFNFPHEFEKVNQYFVYEL